MIRLPSSLRGPRSEHRAVVFALAFIIAVVAIAQGQFLSRPSLTGHRPWWHKNQHHHHLNAQITTADDQNKSNNNLILNQVSTEDLPVGKYEMVAIFDDDYEVDELNARKADQHFSSLSRTPKIDANPDPANSETIDKFEGSSSSGGDYLRPPGSIFSTQNKKNHRNKEALLVTKRLDSGEDIFVDSVYPLFPPGTSPLAENHRPRRQNGNYYGTSSLTPRVPYSNLQPYHNHKPYSPPATISYAKKPAEPDFTKPPYSPPEDSFHRPYNQGYFPTPKPYQPVVKQPVYQATATTPRPSIITYQHPTLVYDDHLPYQLHREPAYHQPEPVKPVHHREPEPYRPVGYKPEPVHHKPYHQPAEPYRPKPEVYRPKLYKPEPEIYQPPKPAYREPELYQPPKPEYHEPEPYQPRKPTYHEPEPYQPRKPVYHKPSYQEREPEYHEPEPYHPPKPSYHEYHEPEPYQPHQPSYHEREPEPYQPTPKPAYHQPITPAYHEPEPYQPTTPAYHEPEPAYHEPEPYQPTPKPYQPRKPAYHEPEPYQPTTPAYHEPEPAYHEPEPYQPTPKPAYHEPEPYQPTPKPAYQEPYQPRKPAYHEPEPPYQPAYHEPEPAYQEPEPYQPKPAYHEPEPEYHEPEPYQPRKPAYRKPEPYQEEEPVYRKPGPYQHQPKNKYLHFPVVESVPARPPKNFRQPTTPQPYVPTTPQPYHHPNHRLPKKQEFSNFPYNPYNDFAEQPVPAKLPEKRKVENSDSNLPNFVTPRTREKSNIRRPSKNKNTSAAEVSTLDKLKSIAGLKQEANGDLVSTAAPFKCPYDGHFADPVDCSRFYKCAHGTPIVEFCPSTLFWNQESEQCDWPENSLCQFDPDAVKPKQLNQKTFLYLTFDDGPNEGTNSVVDALASEDAKATFFINSDNMYDPNGAKAESNQRSLLKIVDNGHILADHSFDHMAHNSKDTPQNAYTNVDQDYQYFGLMNIEPVMDLLWTNGRKDAVSYLNYTLSTFVRLPYTNSWRVPSLRLHHDCFQCTVPASSGQRGIDISNRLVEDDKNIIGWDVEWGVEWSKNSLKYGGAAMFQKLNNRHTKSPQKIVLLMHDIAFRKPEDAEELRTFLRLAKDSGYIISTIDQYETDSL